MNTFLDISKKQYSTSNNNTLHAMSTTYAHRCSNFENLIGLRDIGVTRFKTRIVIVEQV